MAFITTVPEADATSKVRELYETDLARLGYVAAYTEVFSYHPDVYTAWQGLNAAIKAGMDLRRYELITLVAARALRSSYCSLAHGRALLQFFDEEQVVKLALDFRHAGLSPAEVSMLAFAEKVTLQAHEITQKDVATLRAHGFSDAEVVDITLSAAARNFFSRTLAALGAIPDAYKDLSPSLHGALTTAGVGDG